MIVRRCKIPFLIDQQASHELVVELSDPKRSYQPIEVYEIGGDPIPLSREQALQLSLALKEVALMCPTAEEHMEYPGKVLFDSITWES